jgi:hypothetical protein
MIGTGFEFGIGIALAAALVAGVVGIVWGFIRAFWPMVGLLAFVVLVGCLIGVGVGGLVGGREGAGFILFLTMPVIIASLLLSGLAVYKTERAEWHSAGVKSQISEPPYHILLFSETDNHFLRHGFVCQCGVTEGYLLKRNALAHAHKHADSCRSMKTAHQCAHKHIDECNRVMRPALQTEGSK